MTKSRVTGRKSMLLIPGLCLAICCSAAESDTVTIKADIWADNWFALYAGDKLIKEDSVAYDTERSFNAESFRFDIALPANLSIILKDFKENDTGLEYIGTSRQQIGDGGAKAQFFDTESDQLVAASGDSWQCITIHQAPIDKNCVHSSNPEQDCQAVIKTEPGDWKSGDFDARDWPNAIIHSLQAVRPRGGYDNISWRPEAKLIWTDDLEFDNTVLCRFTIEKP